VLTRRSGPPSVFHPGAVAVVAGLCVVATLSACAGGPSDTRAVAGTGPVRAPGGVPSPTVEGPITGPGLPSIIGTSFDLSQVGYSQDEYFISGTATRYRLRGAAPADGRWDAVPAGTAPYKTRLLVYRPTDPRRFNGTVVVEWLNVSVGADTAPDWIADHTELIRQGFAWVGVSAQALGVNGGTSVLSLAGQGLKGSDPARYGSLHHPGDAFSYDIFSQAAQAIRHPKGVSPLGGLEAAALIADGESQSAFFLTTYIDAVAPLARVYDGYLVHSRWSGGASLAGTLALSTKEPFRTDLHVPVLAFETETDLTTGDYVSDRQPDNPWFRDWEVAGTAHADDYTTGVGTRDNGTSNAAQAIVTDDGPLTAFGCSVPLNSGPQHWVLDAAIFALNRWVRRGIPPPHAPRIDTTSGPHPVIRRDAHGNALGGIRTPELDVPIAALSGAVPAGTSLTCTLFGSTTPFDGATLRALYPTHAAYVSDFDTATARAVRAGFILPADARQLESAAAQSNIP
jgi:hypothetical protein